MADWADWLKLLAGNEIMDCAIVGHESGAESVWVSTEKGELAKITPAEIKMLVAVDRSPLFSGSLTVAGVKCTVLRDTLLVNEQNTMDLKTKVDDNHPVTFAISIAKTPKALLICKGQQETHGGILNKKVFEVAEALRKAAN